MLYNQALEVCRIANLVCELYIPEKDKQLHMDYYRNDFVKLPSSILPVIASAQKSEEYVTKMGIATSIRAKYIKFLDLILFLRWANLIEEEHANAIRIEVTKFRKIFIDWKNTFERDHSRDEWDLF